MRKFIRASVLVIALAVSAFGGEIPNGVTSTGEIPNGITSSIPNDATPSSPQLTVTEFLLNLFVVLLP
jgi:hypothetical protein